MWMFPAGRKRWLRTCELLKDKIQSNIRKKERKACGPHRNCRGMGVTVKFTEDGE